jgi:DMSO/TMAO reductase YedYZ molybdopterin-dependent catalytic subunit
MPLRRLLEAAGPKADVVEVLVRSVDGYTDTISFEKAMDPSTFVAYEMNGEPLPERHGYPVRMIVPGLVGEKSVKWVTRIELLNHEAKGFYEQQGWGPDFTVQTHARFDTPDAGQVIRLTETPTIHVRGIAFAGDRGVARVEVSPDGGQTWQEAKRDYTGTRLTWTLWSYEWRPGQVGEHTLVVRATDGGGVLQTPNERSTVPEGATGLHTVRVRVEA